MSGNKFILLYLKYLNKWNKSDCLTSIISCLEEDIDCLNMNELINISNSEHEDTQRMTTDLVISLENLAQELISDNRDKKIDEILKNNIKN